MGAVEEVAVQGEEGEVEAEVEEEGMLVCRGVGVAGEAADLVAVVDKVAAPLQQINLMFTRGKSPIMTLPKTFLSILIVQLVCISQKTFVHLNW